ncbi:transposable element Tcb2 transposase [Trichonephila clavipes]|nr:transposable element Tcb2 transposase [Trichonephila clavipes]
MNLIEHVWNSLGRRVAGRQPPPQTLQELERALLEEWDKIPQLMINSLIDSMPQRLLDRMKESNSVRSPDLTPLDFYLRGYIKNGGVQQETAHTKGTALWN